MLIRASLHNTLSIHYFITVFICCSLFAQFTAIISHSQNEVFDTLIPGSSVQARYMSDTYFVSLNSDIKLCVLNLPETRSVSVVYILKYTIHFSTPLEGNDVLYICT